MAEDARALVAADESKTRSTSQDGETRIRSARRMIGGDLMHESKIEPVLDQDGETRSQSASHTICKYQINGSKIKLEFD